MIIPLSFVPNDIVTLASGSPDMTVMGIDPDGKVRCWWMNAEGITDEAAWPPECLRYA